MKLLVINDGGLWGGGTENRARLLLGEFVKNKSVESIDLLCHCSQQGEPLAGVNVHYSTSSGYRQALNIISSKKIDLVLAHNLVKITPFCLAAAFKKKIPVVWSAHDYWVICHRRRMINLKGQVCHSAKKMHCLRAKCAGLRTIVRLEAYRYLINKCNLGIVASSFLKEMFEKHGVLRNKWQVILPWFDLNTFGDCCRKNTGKKIIFTGPLSVEKGAVLAASAMKYIRAQIPDTKLYFFGDSQQPGSHTRVLIENIGKRDLTLSNIIFGGEKDWPGLKEEYSQAGVYICPPVWNETFGLNWAEAMAAGCPVVASSVGSIPELINGNGVLIKRSDPLALAQAVIGILKNKEYSDRLSLEGQKYANNVFKVERAAEEFIKIFTKLLNKNE